VRLNLRSSGLSIVSLAALAACSSETPTSPNGLRPSRNVQAQAVITTTFCSAAGIGGWVAGKNGAWADPIDDSEWIVPVAGHETDAGSFELATLDVDLPAIPDGATGISLSGFVMADNSLRIILNDELSPAFEVETAESSDNLFDEPEAVGPVITGFDPGETNTLHFRLRNELEPPAVEGQNPMGLDYCFTLEYTEAPPPLVAIFVIGDDQPHAVGDNANFWGAQWWKNNSMTGEVSAGVAAFKGYATLSDNACGGTWTSLPGNSSNPPPSIDDDILVIVTSTVIKAGNDISGDIKKIVMVHHDGNYSDNPGHEGNGPITSIVCTTPP